VALQRGLHGVEQNNAWINGRSLIIAINTSFALVAFILYQPNDAEFAGLEKAGLEFDGPSVRGGTCKTGF
jgi:hypothetical protein